MSFNTKLCISKDYSLVPYPLFLFSLSSFTASPSLLNWGGLTCFPTVSALLTETRAVQHVFHPLQMGIWMQRLDQACAGL